MPRLRVLVLSGVLASACASLDGAADLDANCGEPCSKSTTGSADGGGDRSVPPTAPPPPGSAEGGPDAPEGDAPRPVEPLCDPKDTTLLLCLPFDADDADHSYVPLAAGTNAFASGPGRVGNGATFSNGGITYAYATKLATIDAATVEAFVEPTAYPAAGARAGIFDSDNRFGMFLLPDGTVECNFNGAIGSVMVGPLPLGAFHHVACVNDGSAVMVYLDGKLAGKSSPAPAIIANTSNMSVGQNDPSGDAFVGTIDELRIWNVGRSAAEIAAAAAR